MADVTGTNPTQTAVYQPPWGGSAPATSNIQPIGNSDGSINWGNLLGAGVGTLTNYLGNNSAVGALTGGEQNAIGTQQGVQGALTGIYGGQRALGGGADTTLLANLGLGGTPNYGAFLNSPGFQGSLNLGNQAIERAASANGSLYTPNMLNELGKYDTTYASQNYNNYIGQLLQSAGLGAQGNAGLAQGIYGTGSNISQLQQNQGNARAGGAANSTGIATNLLSRLPYGQIASGIGKIFGSGSNASGVAGTGSSFDSGTGFIPGGGVNGTDYSPYVSLPQTDTSNYLPTDSSGNIDWGFGGGTDTSGFDYSNP